LGDKTSALESREERRWFNITGELLRGAKAWEKKLKKENTARSAEKTQVEQERSR